MPQHYSLTTMFTLLCFLTVGITTSCNSGELSRSQAQSLIEETKEFKSISTLDLMTTAESMKDRHFVNRTSDSDTKEAAMERDLKDLLYQNANIAIAHHLGYIDINQKFIKEQKRFMGIDPNFKIAVTIRTNEKGKEYWENADLPEGIEVNKETQLPIAVKEFGEVTGITKQGENTALVNFTYNWIPNDLGKYLDASEPEFQKLPDDIKKWLQGIRADSLPNKTITWKGKRTGQAIFQKFDDGWRLELVKMN